MFLDLQFSLDKFRELLRDQVQRALPLVTDEFENPLNPQGEKLLVDHLEVDGVQFDSTPSVTVAIEGPSGPASVTGKMVRLQINLTASVTTRSQVTDAGHLGVPPLLPFGLGVKADVSAKAVSGSLVLTLQPVEILAEDLTAEEQQKLLAKLQPIDNPITLPGIAGHAMTVTNAGLTTKGDVIAILAELTPPGPGTVQAWTSFFAGAFTARGGDWSIVLPKDLITEIVDDALTEAVAGIPKENPDVEVRSDPSTSWGLTGPVSKATINAVGACPVGGSDIEADLHFDVFFAIVGDEIQLTVNVTWDLSDWDVFRCGLAIGVLPGAVITAIAGPIGAIAAAVASTVVFIVAVVMISDTAHGDLSSGVSGVEPGEMNLHTVEEDDDHVVIQGHVKLGDLMSGMTPTSIVAIPQGLLLAGTLTVPEHQERSLTSTGEVPFDWSSGYSCSKHQWVVEQLEAKLGMKDPAQYPVDAEVTVLTNPESSYTPDLTLWGGGMLGGFNLWVHSNLPAGSGPDCKLLIHSNSGLRYANLGHLPSEPQAPSQQEFMRQKLGCFKTALPGPQRWLEAIWLVNPPPYERVIEQIQVWEVVVSHVAVGTPVDLAVVDARGRASVVTTLAADAKQTAWFRLATAPGEHIAVGADRGFEDAKLFVGGAAFEAVARFVPHAKAVDAAIDGAGPQARVLIAAGNDVLLLGLNGKALGHATIPGVQRVAAFGNRLMAHAGARVVELQPAAAGRLATARSWQAAQEITQLQARGAQLLVTLRDGSSAALDRHLTPAAPVAAPRSAKWLAEPWLQAPLRVGNVVARVQNGAVFVYRCTQTAVF